MEPFYVCYFFIHKFSPGRPVRGAYKISNFNVCVNFTLKLARFRGLIYGTNLISPNSIFDY
jgi:hypothetical protein